MISKFYWSLSKSFKLISKEISSKKNIKLRFHGFCDVDSEFVIAQRNVNNMHFSFNDFLKLETAWNKKTQSKGKAFKLQKIMARAELLPSLLPNASGAAEEGKLWIKRNERQRKNIQFRIKILCSNRQAKFRWFPIFVFASKARFFVASFHSPAGFFPLWNAFLLFVDILYFRLYGTQRSFFCCSEQKIYIKHYTTTEEPYTMCL